jgi:hypothetical protein
VVGARKTAHDDVQAGFPSPRRNFRNFPTNARFSGMNAVRAGSNAAQATRIRPDSPRRAIDRDAARPRLG